MSETGSEKLYTLTEVSQLTNISMPTLQRYKKENQDRIPSVGKGRTQRYPETALDVFRQLKTESMGRRGRPRKSAVAEGAKKAPARRGRKKAAPEAAAKEGLLTLTQIGDLTGISYPTLLRYTKTHLREIPHRGSGRARRYLPEAVEVFKRLRSESGRGRGAGKAKKPRKAAAGGRRGPGRPPKVASDADLTARIRDLEKSHKQLEKTIARLEQKLDKPFKVVLQRK